MGSAVARETNSSQKPEQTFAVARKLCIGLVHHHMHSLCIVCSLPAHIVSSYVVLFLCFFLHFPFWFRAFGLASLLRRPVIFSTMEGAAKGNGKGGAAEAEGIGKGAGKVGASADTKCRRKALRGGPCRDRSPLPESIETPYKRVRAPDERAWELADLERRHTAARQGREKAFSKPPMRKTKTDVKITAESLNKLFYERDVLKDKLRRRNEYIESLEAQG